MCEGVVRDREKAPERCMCALYLLLVPHTGIPAAAADNSLVLSYFCVERIPLYRPNKVALAGQMPQHIKIGVKEIISGSYMEKTKSTNQSILIYYLC